jgi:EAP30/Vps36 family
VSINFHNLYKHSPHVIDYHKNVLKTPPPQPPKLNDGLELKFKEKNRDKFYDLLKEAMKR